jgi:hypothetical protein
MAQAEGKHMDDRRSALIRNAIMDRITGVCLTVYTADDILTAAGISNDEIDKLTRQLQSGADALAKKARKIPPIRSG